MSAKQEQPTECFKPNSAFSELVFSLPGIRATRSRTAEAVDTLVDQAVIKGTEEYLNQSKSLKYGKILVVLYQIFKLAERGVEGATEALAKCLLTACIKCEATLHIGLSLNHENDKRRPISAGIDDEHLLHHTNEENFWYRCCKLFSTKTLLTFLRQQIEYLEIDGEIFLGNCGLGARWTGHLPVVLLLHLAAGRVLLERKETEGVAILQSFARKQSTAKYHFMSILLYAGDLSTLPEVKAVFASTEMRSMYYRYFFELPLRTLTDKQSFDILVEGALRPRRVDGLGLELHRFCTNCLFALSQRRDLEDRLEQDPDLKNELEREVLIRTYLLRYYSRFCGGHKTGESKGEHLTYHLNSYYGRALLTLQYPKEQDLKSLSISELVDKALGIINVHSCFCLCHGSGFDAYFYNHYQLRISERKIFFRDKINFGDPEVGAQDLTYYGQKRLRQGLYLRNFSSPLLALSSFSTLNEILKDRARYKTPGAIEVLCYAADLKVREWAITQSLRLFTVKNLDEFPPVDKYDNQVTGSVNCVVDTLAEKCASTLNQTLFTASKEFVRSLFDAAERRTSAKAKDLGTAFVTYLDNGNINWIAQIQDQEFRKEILIRTLNIDSNCSNLAQEFILQSEDGLLDDLEVRALLSSKIKARFKDPYFPAFKRAHEEYIRQSRDKGFSTGLVPESNQSLHPLNNKSGIEVRRRISSNPERRSFRFEDMSKEWAALKADFDFRLQRSHVRQTWDILEGFYFKQYYWGILTHGYAGFFRWYLKRSNFDQGSKQAVDAYEESIPPQSIRRLTRALFETREPDQAKRYAQRLLKAQHPEVARALIAGLAHPLPEIRDMFKRDLEGRDTSFRYGASWQRFFAEHLSHLNLDGADRAMYQFQYLKHDRS